MSTAYDGVTVPVKIPEPRRPAETLTKFLTLHRATVADIVPGASQASRRLFVTEVRGGRLTHTVAVTPAGATEPLDTEQGVLAGLTELPADLARTLPRVVGRVEVGPTQVGLVMTAVPGLARSGNGRTPPHAGTVLSAVDEWLAALCRATSGDRVPADFAGSALEAFVDRYGDSVRLRSVLSRLQQAHDRIAGFPVRLSLGHGCLCPAHVRFEHDKVVGVDDWTLGTSAANPLRDLGGFAARVADCRLPEVMAGRTSYAGAFRQFLTAGLERAGLPRQLWRDVLVLGQFERALTTLQRGDSDDIALLMAALRELPGRN